MAQKVRIKNTNIHPLRELFKGEEVTIEAGDYWRDKKGAVREIDVFEANDFRGVYHPVPFDGSGKMVDDARHYKKIVMEPIVDESDLDEEEDDSPVFKCMAKECKHISPSSEELDAHIKVRHPSAERLVLPEVDKDIKKHNKAKKTA